MNLLGKFCAFLLVLSLTLTVSIYILSATLLSAKYLENKAASTNLYSEIATALPASIASGSSPTDSQMIQQTLSSVLTPQYLQNKINPYLDGIASYYESNGPTPQISLTDLGSQLQTQGITVPTGSGLDTAIVFSGPKAVKTAFNYFELLRILTPILSLLLIAAVFFLYQGWHRIIAFVRVCVSAALTEAVIFLLFKATPSLLSSVVSSKASGNQVATILVNFFKIVLGDLANDYGKAAIGFVIAAILILLVGIGLKSAGIIKKIVPQKSSQNPKFVPAAPPTQGGPTPTS
ncbi:MAG: hypothetical protein ACHQUB_02660 [Candidatus Saccharimonadia bacterium]